MLHEKMLISNTNICINSLLDSCHYLLIIFYYAFYVCRIMQKKNDFFCSSNSSARVSVLFQFNEWDAMIGSQMNRLDRSETTTSKKTVYKLITIHLIAILSLLIIEFVRLLETKTWDDGYTHFWLFKLLISVSDGIQLPSGNPSAHLIPHIIKKTLLCFKTTLLSSRLNITAVSHCAARNT